MRCSLPVSIVLSLKELVNLTVEIYSCTCEYVEVACACIGNNMIISCRITEVQAAVFNFYRSVELKWCEDVVAGNVVCTSCILCNGSRNKAVEGNRKLGKKIVRKQMEAKKI